MIYCMTTIKVGRGNVNEVMKMWETEISEYDVKNVASVGGKYLGTWATDIGEKGEITFLFAYPDYAAREKANANRPPKQVREALDRYVKLAPFITYKTMIPASFSPMQ
ncbi:MAG: NIPSNAP family protein [Dehalococcoidales bacterium]|nr:NIPSNAP family protein [Dehalococcoidales bacterium]